MAKNWPLLRVASCPGLVGQGKDLARGGDKSEVVAGERYTLGPDRTGQGIGREAGLGPRI